ncbi:MAG: carbohydrate ABC transporter permease [Propionibacteriaceae bacterium]|nr:carbohydrate ABC transporter permease [Propionibacteriaceae bacterium]
MSTAVPALGSRRARRTPGQIVGGVLGALCTLVLVVFTVFPLLWMFISSLRPATELFLSPPTLLPSEFTLDWYREALGGSNVLRWFINSLVVALGTALISCTVGTLAGYALARFAYPGRRVFMMLLVSAYLFPAILLLMPLYLMLSNYGLVGTLPAIMLAHVAITLPLATWLMKSFVASVPRELEEAALVDGCGPFAAFWRVTLPLLRTGIATTMLFSFVLSWDEYLFASALSQGSTTTAPVGIQTFISSFDIRWGAIMAVGSLVTIPVVVLFVFLQKHFEKGITAGGVKG